MYCTTLSPFYFLFFYMQLFQSTKKIYMQLVKTSEPRDSIHKVRDDFVGV